MTTNEPTKRSVRSYVLRTGRQTESQKRAFDQHWQTYGLEVQDGELDTGAAFQNTQPVVLEVGFGMGESLLAMAKEAPATNFIGVEVHTPGVGRLMNLLALDQVENVRIYKEDAIEVLQKCIPDKSLQRFQLYFPDPWHKKKHHKRRIVQPDFIQMVANKLKRNGVLHMATDWEPYAEHMMEVMSQYQEEWVNLAGDNQFSDRPEFRPKTKFEQRGQRLGHGVWDLLFERRQ